MRKQRANPLRAALLLVAITVLTSCAEPGLPTALPTAAQTSPPAATPVPPTSDKAVPAATIAVETSPVPTTPAETAGPSSPNDAALTAASAPPMDGSPPVRLEIPAIGADSSLMDLGLQDDGTLEVPPDAASVGWFTGGPTPGELGPAVIVGHVDWAGTPGIFYDLRDLLPHNEITITRADGSTAVFEVSSTEQFPKDQFPTSAVYGNLDHAGLRLITCGGSFDPAARSYQDNIVVFANLVRSSVP